MDCVKDTYRLVVLMWALGCGTSGPRDGGSAAETGSGSTADVPTGTAAGTTPGAGEGSSDGASTDASVDTTSGGTRPEDVGDATTSGSETGEPREELNVLYVSNAGSDDNPGTRTEPLRTIPWAVAAARSDATIDTVRVATGTYSIDVANAGPLVVVDGVGLFGGYSLDFLERDPFGLRTVVVDESTQDPVSTLADPAHLISVPQGVTSSTVVDGFRIEIGRGSYRCAVRVEGDATIHGNVFAPGDRNHAITTCGIDVDGGAPAIIGNRFDLVDGLSTSTAHGVRALNSSATVASNRIGMGAANLLNVGVDITGGDVSVVGNSLFAVKAGLVGVRLAGESNTAPRVDNNLIETGGIGTCVQLLGAGVNPTSVGHNVLNCNFVVWGNSDNSVGQHQTVGAAEAALTYASANLKLPEILVDPNEDLQLGGTTPCTVTRGGLDVIAEFPLAIDDVDRTTPLSIGAHEWDGACR